MGYDVLLADQQAAIALKKGVRQPQLHDLASWQGSDPFDDARAAAGKVKPMRDGYAASETSACGIAYMWRWRWCPAGGQSQ